MKSLIEALYYGDIPPFWEINVRTKEYDEKSRKIQKKWEEIIAEFPETETLLEEYRSAHYDAGNVMNFQQFNLGMKIGAQLMLELTNSVKKQGD